ncbi:phage tail spike protein [Clostridium fessum]|uniref:phage tail spike protein n=1 Tax=Clostridium fessum TaxID=2126740 RepID=UPI003AB5B830
MIEVYRSTNTNYQKNGDITLTPLECIFEWGLDGICQIELTHEYDDLGRWEYLVNDNVIAAPTPYSDKQLFRIYKREKSDDEVTVYARHIYYDNLGNYLVDVRPTNKNGQQALDIIFSGTKFTPHSDITTANTAYYVRKNIVEAIAGDDENSFINRWGGERLYDNYDVYIMRQIGSDKGVRAEFGHNLEAIEESVSDEDVVTRIIPVAYNGYVLEGEKPWVDSPKIGSYAEVKGAVINFDDIKLQEDCSEGETGYANLTALRAALVKACNEEYKKGIDDPTVNYTVNMVELANTVEYAEYKQLESVEVGDTITCRHKGIKIEVKARCIRIKWNCITKENEEVELGNFLENYFDKTSSSIQRATASIEGANSQALAAKEVAEKAAKEATSAQTAAETAKGKAETAAGTASTKAQEAQAAAEAASNQVSLAAAQATAAKEYAAAAEAAKTESEKEKTAAGEYAAQAESKAKEAQGAAGVATTQATAAGEHADAARKEAQAAANAKAAAETAQGKAKAAQTAAESAKGKAEAAKAAAESAQGKAEAAEGKATTARTAAESAQGKAEAAAGTAAKEAQAATTARTAAETAQGKAETARGAAETAQTAAEKAKAAAAAAQGKAETAASTAAKQAQEAASAKVAAETAKGKAETAAGTASTKAQEAQAAAEAATAGGENAQHYYELTKELYDNASIQAGQSSEAWLDLSYVNNCYLSE